LTKTYGVSYKSGLEVSLESHTKVSHRFRIIAYIFQDSRHVNCGLSDVIT